MLDGKFLLNDDEKTGQRTRTFGTRDTSRIDSLLLLPVYRTTPLIRRALNIVGRDKMSSDLMYRVVDNVTLGYMAEKDAAGAFAPKFAAGAMKGTHRYLTALGDIANPDYEDLGPYRSLDDPRILRMERGLQVFRDAYHIAVERGYDEKFRLTSHTYTSFETAVSG